MKQKALPAVIGVLLVFLLASGAEAEWMQDMIWYRPTITGHSVAFSPDGRLIAVTTTANASAQTTQAVSAESEPLFYDPLENDSHAISSKNVTFTDGLYGLGAKFTSDDSHITYSGEILPSQQGSIDFYWKPPENIYELYSYRHSGWTDFGSHLPPWGYFLLDNIGWRGASTGSFHLDIHPINWQDPESPGSSVSWSMWSGSNWHSASTPIRNRPDDVTAEVEGSKVILSWSSKYPIWLWDPNVWYHFTVTWGPNGMHLYVNGKEWANNTYIGSICTSKDFSLGQNPGYWPYGPHSMQGYYDEFKIYDTQIVPEPENPDISRPSGYIIYYGTEPGEYTKSIEVGNVSSYELNLAPGTYYIAIAAKASTGFVGPLTKEIKVTVVEEARKCYFHADYWHGGEKDDGIGDGIDAIYDNGLLVSWSVWDYGDVREYSVKPWFVRIDGCGNIIQDKMFGIKDAGSGYYGKIAKHSKGYAFLSDDVLLGLDSNLNLAWIKKIEPTGADVLTNARDNILIGGTYTYGWPSSTTWTYFMLVDPSGNVIDKTSFTGTGEGIIHDVIRDSSGNYVAVGGFGDYGGSPKIIKLDSSLNVLWGKALGTDAGFLHHLNAIIEDPNGNYIAVGDAQYGWEGYQKKPWIVALDKDGNLLWSKIYDYGGWYFRDITITPDGNLLILMNVLMKTDLEGNPIWVKGYVNVGDNKKIVVGSDSYYIVGRELKLRWEGAVVKVDMDGNVPGCEVKDWEIKTPTDAKTTVEDLNLQYSELDLRLEDYSMPDEVPTNPEVEEICGATVTSVPIGAEGQIGVLVEGSKFGKLEVYPNPFKGVLHMRYVLGKRGKVRIYNILGRLVREWEVGFGEGKLDWDGKDMSGRNMSSGVYFIRLEADGVSRSKKVVFVR